ncbi:hypothetical protein PABG_11715 [Paracoccidioides brasiliensis Pb03]|nr:hypothetical protein PABG_11715 [Paracoccidioides brasiliensis Pb03]
MSDSRLRDDLAHRGPAFYLLLKMQDLCLKLWLSPPQLLVFLLYEALA